MSRVGRGSGGEERVKPSLETSVETLNRARSLRLAALALVTALAPDCGGGGGSGSAAVRSPIVVTFPPAHSLTTDSQMVLRGATLDPIAIGTVEANGVTVATGDDFANWSALAAIAAPTTTIRFTGTDDAGRPLPPQQCVVDRSALPVSRESPSFDPARGQILFGEGSFEPLGLVALDVATGKCVVVSGATRGGGALINNDIDAVRVDAANDRAFAIELFPTRILSIELANGDRTTVSDGSSGGVSFNFPRSLDLDAARGRLVVADQNLDALIAVSLANGSRSILSDGAHGSGPTFSNPHWVAISAAQDRALVADEIPPALITVNLATGDRTIVSDGSRGSGPALSAPVSVAFEAGGGSALVADIGAAAVVRVDLATGNRTILSDATHGSGPALVTPIGIELLPDGRAVVAENELATTLAIDPVSGDRSDLERSSVGSGPSIFGVGSLAVDPSSGELLAIRSDALFRVDPIRGDRAVVSSAAVGQGPLLREAQSVAVLPTGRTAFVVESSEGVLAVDLATGARTLVSGDSAGSGTPFKLPECLVLDAARDLAYVGDFGSPSRVVSVDLATGARSEVSGPARGNGTPLELTTQLALAPDGVTLYVLDLGLRALFRVDVVSGDREIASGAGVGAGPAINGLQGGMALSADGTHAFVVDFFNGLLDVDLATGDRVPVAGNGLGFGPTIGLGGPFANGSADQLFAVRFGDDSILQVDLSTGDRAVISR